ncbi:MAG: hypothetical protein IJ948_03765 [Clostridia bacterium]|nr:hypothetical protein [Clostridia bacterium]
MKSFKRILVLALAVVMCLTAFAISSSAAGDFNPDVELLARYNENGDKIIVSITTTQKCGAMMATLTYPTDKGIALGADAGRFVEDATGNTEYFDDSVDGQVKFAVVTDNVAVGSTHWADICFDLTVANLSDDTTFNFTLEDIQVCDIEETLDDAVDVGSEEVAFEYKSLRSLGAQKRIADDALRFGTRVDLLGATAEAANQIVIGTTTYTARRCGYTYGYTNNVKGANSDFADFGVELIDAKTGMDLAVTNPYSLFVRSNKYYRYDAEGKFFVYTLAVTGLNNDKELSVRPYVIYEAQNPAEGDDKFVVINGDVLTNSCDGVNNALAFIGDLGTNYYE